MAIQTQIEQKLAALTPDVLRVENESHMHNVPANSETHFKVTLVSDSFDGMMPVKRHQQIYALLADELSGPVHALALHLYTPREWQRAAASVPTLPTVVAAASDPRSHSSALSGCHGHYVLGVPLSVTQRPAHRRL